MVVNGELFFSATNSMSGSQLWESNGTVAGTTMLTDINPSTGGLNPQNLTAVGNTLYFTANDGSRTAFNCGRAMERPPPWSPTSTRASALFPQHLTNVDGTLYFVGYNLSDGYQLYTSNGTASGTVMVADINGTHGTAPPT